jgi:hypothetical protein
MNITLWSAAGALAVLFLGSGAAKLFMSKEKLEASGLGLSLPAVKAIGTLEVLAAIGLILPATVDIAPVLVPLAAVGLVLLMFGATVFHLRRGELRNAVVTSTVFLVAAFVAWGRFGPYSFVG